MAFGLKQYNSDRISVLENYIKTMYTEIRLTKAFYSNFCNKVVEIYQCNSGQPILFRLKVLSFHHALFDFCENIFTLSSHTNTKSCYQVLSPK